MSNPPPGATQAGRSAKDAASEMLGYLRYDVEAFDVRRHEDQWIVGVRAAVHGIGRLSQGIAQESQLFRVTLTGSMVDEIRPIADEGEVRG